MQGAIQVLGFYPRRGAILLDFRVGTLLEEEEEFRSAVVSFKFHYNTYKGPI